MSAAQVLFFSLVAFALGYRLYARYLSQQVFALDDREETPATTLNDDRDFVPTRLAVLWGHHFSSVAGAAPIVGPAVAIIWGWVPAVIWVVFGSLFLGAAHDFATLVISMRHRGQSMAQVAGEVLSPRLRNLFMLVVLFLVWMVIAVFTLVIANLFISFPSSVLPVHFQILVALGIGLFVHRRGGRLLIPTLLGLIALVLMIDLGTRFPIVWPESLWGLSPLNFWILSLLIYSYFASTLPVWVLLQPRDYINSFQLLLGLSCLILGLFVLDPPLVAPAFQGQPAGAPKWFPLLFMTIACGAISGFHGLVSAGTTSKQVARWSDAKPIAYGGMLGEATLALLATMAVASGFESSEAWHRHYGDWEVAQGLSQAMSAFVSGSSRFLQSLGFAADFSQTMMSVLIISFAATSLDTATRIQRYLIGEIGEAVSLPQLKSAHVGTGLAVGSAALLMLLQEGGRGGLLLWPLFGANNQMLAALSLIIVCTYLKKAKRPWKAFLGPLLFVLFITIFGLALNTLEFYEEGQWLLSALALSLLLIELWMVLEAWQALRSRETPDPVG